MKQRKYSDELKAEILAAYTNKEKTAEELSIEHNIPKQYIYTWASDAKKQSVQSYPEKGQKKVKIREAAKEVQNDGEYDSTIELEEALNREREEVKKMSIRLNAVLDALAYMRS